MIIGPVSPWLVWGVLALAVIGAWAVLWQAGQFAAYLRERWHDRGEDDEETYAGLLDAPLWVEQQRQEWLARHPGKRPAWVDDMIDPPPLPPERSREELGFTGEQPAIAAQEGRDGLRSDAPDHRGPGWPVNGALQPHRERRAPWWEAEHRAAYQSLGLDYPSGLLARVREAGQ